MCEKYLDRPTQLATDYVLARVYKHSLIIMGEENLLGDKAIENEFYHFKEMFNTKVRREDTKTALFNLVRQIHTLKTLIL